MIPQAYISEWSQQVPWQTNEQVEQDLIISRALVAIFSDGYLASNLAFRGGTALHKLYLQPQPRYSEDIDLVQIKAGPIKEIVQRLQTALDFLGAASVAPRKDGIRLKYGIESEFPPVQNLRLKVEVNTREHFSVYPYQSVPFQVASTWFTGNCELKSYRLEELLGTKLRALYQRKKGRDLFDLWTALKQKPDTDTDSLLQSYRKYMQFSVDSTPSKRMFMLNMEAKMLDSSFLGDTTALLRPDIIYKPEDAYELVKANLIKNM